MSKTRPSLGALLAILLALLALGSAHAASREPIDVVVLLDNSGSMARHGSEPGNDERFMRVTAVQYLLEKMAPGDRIALVTFDSVVHLDPDASRLRDVAAPGMPQAFEQGIRNIAASPSDSTDMAAGFHAAEKILRTDGQPGRRRFLIFLTDGTPNPERGENTPPGLEHLADVLGGEGIVIYTIGLGGLSPDPQAADAKDLLEEIARRGHGDMQMAARAEDLPPLFGAIFARLAGHEISRTVPAGGSVTFTITPGTHNLRVLATSEGAPPELQLKDQTGKIYSASVLPPLLTQGQTARIAVDAIRDPPLGEWTAQATRGTLEVAWEPDFEAALLQPISAVPSHAPVTLVVEVRQRGTASAAAMPRGGRVVVSYETTPGAAMQSLTLTEDPAHPARFTGTLPDSGGSGPHHLTAQCYRSTNDGEDEGGPAFAVVQVMRLPVLTLLAPAAGTSYSVPDPIPVRAQATVDGTSVSTPSVTVQARLAGPSGGTETPLTLHDGAYSGSLSPGAMSGSATLTATLSGTYDGTPLTPQTVSQTVTLTPTPIVRVHWPAASTLVVDPGDDVRLNPIVTSSAPSPQSLSFTEDGISGNSVTPPVAVIPADQPPRVVGIHFRITSRRPGDYPVTVTARLSAGGASLAGESWTGSVHVRSWLERNRGWLYPLLVLLLLLALLTTIGTVLWLREQARRRQKMLDLLNGAKVYVSGSAAAYSPPKQKTLTRRSYTFGGEGADVPIPDPAKPGQPLFKEPRLCIGVAWKSGRGQLLVTPEGTQTQWYDMDGHLLASPLIPTEGGATFRIEPEHVLVSVHSTWTL